MRLLLRTDTNGYGLETICVGVGRILLLKIEVLIYLGVRNESF